MLKHNKTLITLILTLIINSNQKLLPLRKNPKITSKILKEFPGYEMIFHFDYYTQNDLLEFFQENSYLTPRILLKYDYQKISNVDMSEKRPIGNKYIHLVYLQNPFFFEMYSNLQFNLEFNDIVLFITQKDLKRFSLADDHVRMMHIWNQKGLDKCGCIFIYDIKLNIIYFVHYYVGISSGILKQVNNTLVKTGTLLNYRNKFNDFNGHVFHVAYYPYEPFIWCSEKFNKDTNSYEYEVQGIDGNILLLLSNYLNFKFVMRKAHFKPGGGLWKSMIEDVHFERRDWAIGGISTSLERLQLADFTTMLHMESYTAFFVTSEVNSRDLHGILRPFEPETWIYLSVLLILVAFILGLSQKVDRYQTVHSDQLINEDNTLKYIRIPFRAIIDQTVPLIKIKSITISLLVSVWYLASIILTTAYRSKLASTMITPRILEPNTVIDLFNEGYSFQVNTEDWTVLKESLLNSMDDRYKNLLDRCFDDLDFCEAVRKTFKGKVAVFDEETAMPFIIFNTCRDLYGPNEMSRFRLVKQQLFPSVHAWPLRLGAPYRHRFSYTIQLLISAGIIEHWYQSLIGKSIIRSNSFRIDSSITGALSWKSFTGPFLVLVIGSCLSTIIFLVECLLGNYFKKLKCARQN